MALRSITIPVPPALEQRLRPYQDRLPELLERGIDVLAAEDSAPPQDESTILEVLTSNPTPGQILALRPSPNCKPAPASCWRGASGTNYHARKKRSWTAT